MKKTIYYILSILVLMLVTVSCNDSEMELNKGNTPLALSVSNTEAHLDVASPDKEAVAYNWTSGTNYGTDASISYVFQMDIAGNGFKAGIKEDLGKNIRIRTFTVEELNTLLLETFGKPVGAKVSLEARVIATVHSQTPVMDTTEVVQISVTPYKPLTKTLYLIGDATPNSWDAGKATAMAVNTGEVGGFLWTGKLTQGKFKFITTLGQFAPSYNKGTSDTKLYFRESFDDPYDEQFEITEGGTYRVLLNVLNLTISIQKLSSSLYTQLWMLGDATPGGWDNNAEAAMSVDPLDPFVFHYNGTLKVGDFKIATETGTFDCKFYRPTIANAPVTETDVELSTSPDNKWRVTEAGDYKIRLDIGNLKIQIKLFVPYTQLWMIGDATPNGWNDAAPNPMTKDATNPYIFTYEGALNAGEFKIPTAVGTNWSCDYFMPAVAGEGVESTHMTFVEKGGPDRKWKITVAGNYKIVINQFYETISITKQ